MSTNERIESLLKQDAAAAADNLHRARAAFRHMTAAEMAKEHGESGVSRADILSGYEREYAEASAALDEWRVGKR